MRKPKFVITLYQAAMSARLRAKVRRTERRIRRFDQLMPDELDRFVVSRRHVLTGESITHESASAIPERQELHTGDLSLTVLQNVVVDVHFGFAITDTGLLLEETAINRHVIDRHLVTGKLLRPTVTLAVDRPVMCLECGPNKSNFFHFWFQSLTKLLWATEPELQGLGPMYLVHTRVLQPWQVTLLRAALPPETELLRVDRTTLVRTPLYVDLPPYNGTALDPDTRATISDWARAVVDATATEAPLPTRFYVSRRGGKVRHALNESTLEKELAPRGIPTVVLEDLTMGDQIRLFAQADVIVAQHGAGLANLLHARPQTRLLEIFSGSPKSMPLQYRGIAAAIGMSYSNLFCGSDHHNDDVALPVAEIVEWVDGATKAG